MENQKKLTIAMICDPIGGNKSGVVVSTLRFSKLLQNEGHKVIFIAARSEEHRGHSDHDGVKAYRFRSLPVPESGGWNLAFPRIKELKKIFIEEGVDIVHIILPMSGALVAIKAARALGIKIVAHSHSQPENLFIDMPKFIQPTLNTIWNRYLAWIYSKSEVLIYPSEMAKNLLEKLGKENQDSSVISNGINRDHFKVLDTGDFHERYNLPVDKKNILFVGRLFPEKSIDTLIRAVPIILKQYQNAHIMIVGGGRLQEKLEKLVGELGITKNVTFLGLVSEEDKILAYNAADIFVLPSLAELEGMVVLEAMATGLPILIADSEMSASRFFVNGNGFLFKSRDYGDLAEKALLFLQDDDLRKTMGEQSLENSKDFDIKESLKKLIAVYNRALEK